MQVLPEYLSSKVAGIIAALGLALGASQVNASTVTLDFSGTNVYSTNNPETGAAATVSLEFADVAGNVEILFTILNTTGNTSFGAGATAATFTGFALDLVNGLSLISTDPTYVSGVSTAADELISPVDFGGISNGGGGAGIFAFGIADNDNFEGGNANEGLTVGQTVAVSLLFDTTDTAAEVMAAYAVGLFDPNSGLNAAIRFQQVSGGAGYAGASSDKLLFIPPDDGTSSGGPPAVPLPAGLPLLLTALGFFAVVRRKSRKAM